MTPEEIRWALSRPFDKEDVETRPQGGVTLRYAQRHAYIRRLDEVLGPDG